MNEPSLPVAKVEMEPEDDIVFGVGPGAFSELFLQHHTLVDFRSSSSFEEQVPDPRDRSFARFRGRHTARRYWNAFRESLVGLIVDQRAVFGSQADAEGYLSDALPLLSEGLPPLGPMDLGDGGYGFGGDLPESGALYLFVFRVHNVVIKIVAGENHHVRHSKSAPALELRLAMVLARACEEQIRGHAVGPLSLRDIPADLAPMCHRQLRHARIVDELKCRGSAFALSGDGRRMLLDHETAGLSLWDLDRRRSIRSLENGAGPFRALTLCGDKSWAAAIDAQGEIQVWEASSGYSIGTLDGLGTPASHIALSRDGRFITAGGTDGTVGVWDIASRTCMARTTGPRVRRLGSDRGSGHTSALAIANDGSTVFVGTLYSWIWAWDPARDRIQWTEDTVPQQIHGINGLASFGWRLSSVTPEGTLEVRDGRTGTVLHRMGRQGRDWFLDVATSDLQGLGMAVTHKSAVFFDLDEGALVAHLPAEFSDEGIARCALSDDAEVAVCTTPSGRVLVWRLEWNARDPRSTPAQPPPVAQLGPDQMYCPECGAVQFRFLPFCFVCSARMNH